MGTPATIARIPSNARVIVLDGFGAVPRGTLQVVPQPLVWPTKDPNDVLDYVLDISEALAGNEGDSISTLDTVISPANPGDLVLQSSYADGAQAILWLSQGFAATTYSVTITIGTTSGRSVARTVMLPVLALATPPVPPTALTDQNGAPIIDQSNNPITTS